MSRKPPPSASLPGVPGTLKIRLVKGKGILNRETLGCSDPYVRVVDPAGNNAFETSSCSATQQPEWANDASGKTSLRVYRYNGVIRLQVWDKNVLSDSFLGEAEIPVADAIGFEGQRHFQLQPRPNEKDEVVIDNKNNLGTLTASFSFESEPLTNADRVTVTESPKLPATMHVQVVGAVALRNRESTGTSDPYVRVIGPDGSKLFKTPHCPSTLNPQWTKEGATGKFRVKAGATGTVCFQVWDKNAVSDDLMGEVQVPVEEACAFASEKNTTIPLILRAREREEDGFLLKNQRSLGSLSIKFTLEADSMHGEPDQPPGTLDVIIDSASNLFNRDAFGSSDPYVVVRDYAGKKILETPYVDSCLSPEWQEADASTSMRIYGNDATMQIEVWDHNKLPLRDSFLGQVTLTCEEMLRLATEPESTLALRPRAKEKDRVISKNQEQLGTINVQFRFKNEKHFHRTMKIKLEEGKAVREPPGELRAWTMGCRQLFNRERTGTSDPYIKVVDQYGKDVFKSKPCASTLDPEWYQDGGEATIRLAHMKGLLKFQIWDKNVVSDDLLGEHVMTVTDALLYAESGMPATFRLRPREHETEKVLIQQPEGGLGEVSIQFDFTPDQTPIPEVDVAATKGVITLQVLGAKNLFNAEATGVSDPYAKVIDQGDRERLKLEHEQNTLNPVWERRNICDVSIFDQTGMFKIQVWDHNAVVDDIMGEARVRVEDLLKYATLADDESIAEVDRIISLPLRPRVSETNKTVMKNEHKLGTVQVLVNFTPGDAKLTAAEKAKADLFAMDIPLRYVIDHIEKAAEAKLLSRELMLYLPFLACFILFSFARRDTLQEHYIAGGYDQQLTRHEIAPDLFTPTGRGNGLHHFTAWWELMVTGELHLWLQTVVAPHFWDWRHPSVPSKQFGPFGVNKAIGAVRLRILRVRNDSCVFNEAFIPSNTSSYNTACFANYDTAFEEKQAIYYAPSNYTIPHTDGCAFLGVTIAGDLGRYPCGGHIVDLPLSMSFDQALQRLVTLEDMAYVNETSTRFFVLEFFTYNAALDMFTGAKYFIEITNGGGWVSTAQVRTFRVNTDAWISFFFIFDIFFTLFVLYYWVKFFMDWYRHYRRTRRVVEYLISVWTLLEIVNLIVFSVALGIHFEWYRACDEFTSNIGTYNPDAHPERLNYILNLFFAEVFANAGNSVLCFLKILKFLKMNNKLNILTRTMSRATENILGILAIFFLIMAAYALSGVQLYGAQLFEFRNVNSAFSLLFRALMGSFDYEELRVKSRGATFVYFWSFIVLGLFIMLNFITAIIGSAYEQEQDAEKTLPLAVAMRRTMRELQAFSWSAAISSTFNAVVTRTRRLRMDVIYEYIVQYRSTMLIRDGIDEDRIRAGEEDEPEYLINRSKFVEIIPKKDMGTYISTEYLDNVYLEIAEDYDLLHHDEEAEAENDLEEQYSKAIAAGFSKIITKHKDDMLAVQAKILTGDNGHIVATDAKDAHDALRTAGQGADAAFGANAISDTAGASALGGKSDDAMSHGFDSKAATEVLLEDCARAIAEREGAGKRRKVPALRKEVEEQKRRVTERYMEAVIGRGNIQHGLHGVLDRASDLELVVQQLRTMIALRSHSVLEPIADFIPNAVQASQ